MNRLLLCFSFISVALTAIGQNKNTTHTEKIDITVDTIQTGIAVPWGLAFLPNGDILITDKAGELRVIRKNKIEEEPVGGVPKVYTRGQAGLFDIELDPDFAKNGWLYLSYAAVSDNKDEPGGMTYIMRAKLKNNKLTDQQILFKGSPFTTGGNHFGARMEFDKKGDLFFSIGERGEKEKAQSLETYNGKVYRIHADGSIPKDNPFVNTPKAVKAAYSYGHRNPQGLALNPWSGEMWETEHGPMGGDELNIIQKGKNYGWPVISYGINYDGTIMTKDTVMTGMEQPQYFWRPSIATSNLLFVNSDKYPEWKGDILVCSLKFQNIERLEMADNKVIHKEKLLEGVGRIRTVAQSPDGYLYVAVEGGKLLRIVPLKK